MRWVIAACCLAVAGGCGVLGSSSAAEEASQAVIEEAHATPARTLAPASDPEPSSPVASATRGGPLQIEPPQAGAGHLPHEPATAGTRHAAEFGWSADGKSFVLCVEGSGPRECTFTLIDGKAESMSTSDGPGKIDQRLRASGYEKGPLEWAHGDGVKLTWRAPDGKVRLEIGAHLSTGEQVTDLVWMDFDPEHGDDAEIFPEVVSVAPEGDRIAIVGHVVGPKRHEFKTILLHSDDFAARAYSQAGFDHLAEERFERAVTAFERATVADPNGWEHAYNLACGRARLGHGNVRRPLTRAIDLGGEKVRTKAHRDAALAGVKRTDWFKDLVTSQQQQAPPL